MEKAREHTEPYILYFILPRAWCSQHHFSTCM